MTADKIVARLLAEVQRQKMTPRMLSVLAGLPYSAAHKFVNGNTRRMTLETACLVAQAVGWRLEVRT